VIIQTNEPDPETAIIVDLQINSRVLDAATARLPLVQHAERRKYGKARTNLSTLGEQILRDWEPTQTQAARKNKVVICPACQREVSAYRNLKMRLHGPVDDRCPQVYATNDNQPGVGRPPTRPLRFPMPRGEYEQIKNRIQVNNQSVAAVVTQRLATFAREGHL
jgi:hypothetical protein